jgi:hypothetical protein
VCLSSEANVDSSELVAVFGIRFGVEGHLLTFVKGLEALDLNGREVYEHVGSALIAGNEAVTLFCIKPLDCTCFHSGTSIKK